MQYGKSELLLPLMALAVSLACVAAFGQTPAYNLGRTPSPEDLRTFDVSIAPDGKGLPPGSGTAKEGATIFAQKCARCHGPTGKENGLMRENTPEAVRFRPFATTIWDSINRTMPPGVEDKPVPGSLALLDKNNVAGTARRGPLTADEVYALTAYLLYTRGLIQENEVIDAKSLPKIQMPNRKNFVPLDPTEWKPGLNPGGMRHISPKK